jgi:DeoR/GlpR family transcriptional regulator of sugar metabolism
MSLLDVFIDKALSSSKTILTLAEQVAALAKEVKSLKETLNHVINVMNVQQVVLDELLQETIESAYPEGTGHPASAIKNLKKEKPN